METRLFSWCRALEKSPDPERLLLLLHWICSCRWSLSRVQFLGHFLCIHAVCSIWWGQGLQRTHDAIWKFSILTVYMVRNLLVHHCFIGSGRRAGESQGWDVVLRTLRSCHGDRTVTVPKGERRGGWAGGWGGWHGIGSARWMIFLCSVQSMGGHSPGVLLKSSDVIHISIYIEGISGRLNALGKILGWMLRLIGPVAQEWKWCCQVQ